MTTLREIIERNTPALLVNDDPYNQPIRNMVPARLVGPGDVIKILSVDGGRRLYNVTTCRESGRNLIEMNLNQGEIIIAIPRKEQVDLVNRRITKEEPMHFSKTSITDAAKEQLTKLDDPLTAVFDMVAAHSACDWGEVSEQVADMNREELSRPREVSMPVMGLYRVEGREFIISAFYQDGKLQKRLLALNNDPMFVGSNELL